MFYSGTGKKFIRKYCPVIGQRCIQIDHERFEYAFDEPGFTLFSGIRPIFAA